MSEGKQIRIRPNLPSYYQVLVNRFKTGDNRYSRKNVIQSHICEASDGGNTEIGGNIRTEAIDEVLRFAERTTDFC